MSKQLYRQGDVLLQPVRRTSKTQGQDVPREGGRVILAHGEVTGHAHAITCPKARLVAAGDARFLHLPEPADLSHEEHATIALPAGTYRVIRQREYSPEAIRNVAD